MPSPTFDAANIVTRTPAPAAECPAEQAGASLNLPLGRPVSADLITFLNSGGSFATVRAALEATPSPNMDSHKGSVITSGPDLTGDGVPEIFLSINNYPPPDQSLEYAFTDYVVLSCANGVYQELYSWSYGGYDYFSAQVTQDVNRNGVPELLIVDSYSKGFHSDASLTLLEWDGQALASLLNDEATNLSYEIRDVDNNGMQEILITYPYYSSK
jgi:hypothetical protein